MNNDFDKIKLEKIEKNCYEIARKQLKEMQENNAKLVEETVENRMAEYKDNLANKFEYDSKDLKRDFNKEIYEFEMDAKARVNSSKENLKKGLYSKVVMEIEGFINSEDYKGYLLNNIKNSIQKEKLNAKAAVIYITERDFYRFENDIKSTFGENVETIPNDNIGGSIIIDREKKISVDNTIKTNILSKIDEIKI